MKLRTKSTEKWISLPDGAQVLVRNISMSKSLDIVRKFTTVEALRGVGQVENRDFAAINRETYLYKILDWKGLLDDEGKDFPFSRENLLLVIEHDQDFLAQVDQIADNLNKAERTAQENLLGNS